MNIYAAEDLNEGMYLDLEGDKYASALCMPGCPDCERVVESFHREYQKVESVEVVDEEGIVNIDCENVSMFAVPRDHRFKVAVITEASWN